MRHNTPKVQLEHAFLDVRPKHILDTASPLQLDADLLKVTKSRVTQDVVDCSPVESAEVSWLGASPANLELDLFQHWRG